MKSTKQVSLTVDGVTYVEHDIEALIAKLGRGKVEAALYTEELKEIRAARSVAYRLESDPLYMEWKYDQTPESEQTWRDKVEQIKNRYPLPQKF